MNVIDLDEAAARPVGRPVDRLRRWRRAVIAAALLLVGALIGSFITYRQVAARQEQVRNSTVSVLVLATINPADGGAARVAGTRRPASVATGVQVTIVNTGPVEINVPSLSGAQRGVTLSITDKQRWINPGTSITADALVTVQCAIGYPLRELEAMLSVTVDDTSRLSPVKFDASSWNDQLEEPCR